jgi:NAD(P)-dependent dehydrogenase (short-subunit alcohol dehydrogenase family)
MDDRCDVAGDRRRRRPFRDSRIDRQFAINVGGVAAAVRAAAPLMGEAADHFDWPAPAAIALYSRPPSESGSCLHHRRDLNVDGGLLA